MMIKNLLLLLLIGFAFTGCKKADEAKGKLTGSWYIKNIKPLNGSSNSGLNFTSGKFTFKEDGRLEYVDAANLAYKGTWSSQEIYQTGNCYTYADGTQDCDHYWDRSLLLDVERLPPPGGQLRKIATFESFKFIDANNFTAVLTSGSFRTHQYTFAKFQ